MITLGIDPGECTGIAWGIERDLVAVDAQSPGGDLVVPPCCDIGIDDTQCVIELPKFYPVKAYGSPRKATAVGNSLIRESVTLGRWEERAVKLGFSIEERYPREWKGTAKKRAMCKHVISRMTTAEKRMVAETIKRIKLAKSKTHNILDAIGLFFWKVGRL